MSKVLEFIGFNAWLIAVTGISAGVFRLLGLMINAADLPSWIAGPLWLCAIAAFVGTWYFVGSRSMRLIQRYYDWRGKH